ncbi:MAG: glycosyltransferase family 2 protein [Xanthobacteraceae bacterium]|nr:glycosyltransferase family 2 protein [Xanthobacteraceae bacterium]QYK45020.1 MAG: glycosyltransferase family 2 protein [Xanthobacteraceae bacterium]
MIPNPTEGVRYSLVIPVYNEEAVLPLLLHRLNTLLAQLDAKAEAIFVDDGSRDTSSIILEAKAKDDPRIRFIRLSRNFGHQIAITAGMDVAAGDAIIVMDADLQDPPEVILEMIARWKEGYDIVQARRLSRDGESAFKKKTAAIFYRLLGKLSSIDIPRDVGDFRLIDRKVLEAFREMPERDRFVRGMFAWLGFKQTEVAFHRPARAAGETKYPFWKMVRLAVNGVVSFSDAPLKAAIWCGAAVSALAVLYGVYSIFAGLFSDSVVRGWTSTVVIVSFLCGLNMLLTGMVGLYVGRIHAEVKRRPLYVVAKKVGFRAEEKASRDDVRAA